MSFQAYLDSIEKKTGKPAQAFIDEAKQKNLFEFKEIIAWLKTDHQLGLGHARALAELIRNSDKSQTPVDAWFVQYDNPHKRLMMDIRAYILSLDPKLGECIKWQAPTFTYKGNIASFNPRSKKHVSLMFHTGAKIPGSFEHLIVSGDTAAYMTFTEDDFEEKRDVLKRLIHTWIKWKDVSNS